MTEYTKNNQNPNQNTNQNPNQKNQTNPKSGQYGDNASKTQNKTPTQPYNKNGR